MCRLLGFVADRPLSAREVLGSEQIEAFTSLSSVHGDGWGMASYDQGRVERVTSPQSAASDSAYDAAVGLHRATAEIVHLRWATEGLQVEPNNSHPFGDDELALAHNGFIAPLERLEGLLSEQGRAALRGGTDSERYFQFVRDQIRACGDETAGVRHAVDVLAREFPNASLNAMLLSAAALYIVHVNSRATPPTDDLREIFDDEASIPPGHIDQYFQLGYRIDAHGVAFVSSGLTERGWTPVPPDSVARIDRTTRKVEWLR